MTMAEQPTLLSFAPVEWRRRGLALLPATRGRSIGRTFTSGILGTCLLLLGAARAEATPITWHWAGPVSGYACIFGGCTPGLDTAVPLGTTVDVFVTLDPDLAPPNPSTPCYR